MTIKTRVLAFAGLLLTTFTLSAWRITGSTQPVKPYSLSNYQDTTRPGKRSGDKKDIKVEDLDQAMKDLDKAMEDVDKTIRIDLSKMDKEIKMAMEEIKKIDFEKIGRDVESSLKTINWEKTRLEVDKAMHEAEIKIKEVDMKKIGQEIQRAKEQLSAEKIMAHVDMDKIKKSVHDGLANARAGIENAKKELGQLKEFTDTLEKDGLISKKKGYKIEIRNGDMYINRTLQSKEVNDKYRKYFTNQDLTIRSDGDSITNL